MPEIRTDALLGHRVLMAPERGERPIEQHTTEPVASLDRCPFCRGHEDETPGALFHRDAAGRTTGDWVVRAIPNRYPALDGGPPVGIDESSADAHSEFRSVPGTGHHEVLIESSDHVTRMEQLSAEQFGHVVRLWLSRCRTMQGRHGIAHTTLFKNSGAAAGASIAHIHSQLIGTPFIPRVTEQKMQMAARFHERYQRSIWSEVLRHEEADGSRVVTASRDFVVLCPFASRFVSELQIIPRRESPHFTEVTPAEEDSLAETLRDVLQRLAATIPNLAFNLAIFTAPIHDKRPEAFHWHIEITPRVEHLAGFEISSGEWINTLLPEDAAERLRSARTTADVD